MTAKEFLNRAWKIDLRVRHAQNRLEELRARMGAVKSSAPRKAPRGGRARAWTDAVDSLCDAEAALVREIAALYRVQAEVRAAINTVDNVRWRAVLECRYLDGMKWQDIAEEMGYEVRTVTRMHGKALKAVRIADSG